MKKNEKLVKEICDKVYLKGYQQITIDLIQDDIEEMLQQVSFTREDIGASSYTVSILKESINPAFEIDIQLLTELDKALNDWHDSIEFVNMALGLSPES